MLERVLRRRRKSRVHHTEAARRPGWHVTGGDGVPGEAGRAVRRLLAAQLAAVVVEHLLVGKHGVEDPHDRRVDALLAVVGHRQRLGVALGLVVDAARPDRVDVPPVLLGLGVDVGVAVDLGGGGEEEARPLALGQAEGVVRPQRPDLEGGDGQLEVVDRRGRAPGEDAVLHRRQRRDPAGSRRNQNW